MGDLVTCKTVLKRSPDDHLSDRLYLAVPPDNELLAIPCWPKGTPQRGPLEYEETDGRLQVTPSVFASDTGFHTDNPWSCDYELCPPHVQAYDHFYALNPHLKK